MKNLLKRLKNEQVLFFEDDENPGFYWIINTNGKFIEFTYGKLALLLKLSPSNFLKIQNNNDFLKLLDIKRSQFWEQMRFKRNNERYIKLSV